MTTESMISLVGLLVLILGGYVKLMTKIKELEIRLAHVEKEDDKIMEKLDSIAEAVTQIQIDLQNKQNRQ